MEPFVRWVLLLSAMFLAAFIASGAYAYKNLKPVWDHEKRYALIAVLVGAVFLLIGCIMGILF